MRILATLLSRAFWFAIFFLVMMALLIAGILQLVSGIGMLFLSIVGIVIGFSLLRLATAPVTRNAKSKRPARVSHRPLKKLPRQQRS